MKNINGIDYSTDMVISTTSEGSMIWNREQTHQVQAPQRTTVKFRVLCKSKQEAMWAVAYMVGKAMSIAKQYGCVLQESCGMTNRPHARKFGATFHGDRSREASEAMLAFVS